MKMKQQLLFAALLLSCFGAGSWAPHLFSNANISNSSSNQTFHVEHEAKKANATVSDELPIISGLNCEMLQANTTPTSASVKLVFKPTKNALKKNFTIGYATDRENFSPAVLTYYVQQPGVNVPVARTYEIPKQTKGLNDIVSSKGPNMQGKESLDVICSFDLNPGEKLVTGINSGDKNYPLTISNIYEIHNYVKCEQCGKFILEDVEDCPYCNHHQSIFDTPDAKDERIRTYQPAVDENGNFIKGKINYSIKENLRPANLNDFLSVKYAGKSSFNGTGAAQFDAVANLTLKKYGELLRIKSPSSYRIFQQSASLYESGEYKLEVSIRFNAKTQFVVTYEDDTVNTFNGEYGIVRIVPKESGKISHFVIYSDQLIKPFKDIRINRFNVAINSIDTTINAPVKLVDLAFEYSGVDLGMQKISYVDPTTNKEVIVMTPPDSSYNINVDALFIGVVGGFILVYEAISLFVYFYWKKKYADDVFRRMRTKPYWTNNTMGLVASGSLLISILSIVCRFSILNNSMIVYNSIDILIVLFSVVAIIFCGYFIKYFIVQIKNIRDKRINDKLHLNQDKVDDGTLIISTK